MIVVGFGFCVGVMKDSLKNVYDCFGGGVDFLVVL